MAGNKVDGIIEAVHYTPGGRIAVVRAYERHGAVWSDRILLEREDLVNRLKSGKRYMTGHRKIYLGGVFETEAVVRDVDGQIVSNGQAGKQDHLNDVPVF